MVPEVLVAICHIAILIQVNANGIFIIDSINQSVPIYDRLQPEEYMLINNFENSFNCIELT